MRRPRQRCEQRVPMGLLHLTPQVARLSSRCLIRRAGGPTSWAKPTLTLMTEPAQKSSRHLPGDTADRLVLIIEDDVAGRATKIRALATCKRVSVLGVPSRDCVAVALAVAPRALLLEATDSGELSAEVREVLERDHRVSALMLGHERTERARRKYPAVAARFYGIAAPIRTEEIEAFITQPPLAESWAGSFSPAECLRAA